MFTREQIVSFCAVYEKGSYSAAARHLGRDRSTVREHVNILEDTVGLPLFDIQGRQAVPTEVARVLFPRGVTIARQIEEFEKAALNSFNQEISTLNIYHDAIIPLALMSYVEEKMSEVSSLTQINWLHKQRRNAMEDLVSGEAHLALMPIKMMVHPDKEVNFINLGSIDVSVYTGVDSPLANKQNVRLADLQLEKQYICENHFDASLQGAKISPDYSLVSNYDVLIEFLRCRGWAAIPDAYAKSYCDAGIITAVDCYEVANAINYNICVFFSPALEHNKIISTAMEMIKEYAIKNLK
ncbi:LysR family transcriptional regulator [Vibrio sp. T187]|nr:LysR family transcriptional regulator [Vibrio sp. T187]